MGRGKKTKKAQPVAAQKAEPVPAPTSSKPQLYPAAQQVRQPAIATHGKHETADGLPAGAVIHYTADGEGLDGTLSSLATDGYGYHFIIDRAGKVFQLRPLMDRLYHAGHVTADMSHNLHWGAQNINPARTFCGIALDLWGVLRIRGEKFHSWTNKEIPASRVRLGGSEGSPSKKFAWEEATTAQITALTNLCVWLVRELKMDPSYFCGHDEIRRDKMDPGGCLPFSMSKFRDLLAKGIQYGHQSQAPEPGDES